MVFGVVVGQIMVTRGPVHSELALLDSVFEPIVPHVHCFGLILFARVVGDAGGCGIVHLEWCGRLRVPKFGEGMA